MALLGFQMVTENEKVTSPLLPPLLAREAADVAVKKQIFEKLPNLYNLLQLQGLQSQGANFNELISRSNECHYYYKEIVPPALQRLHKD